MIRKAILGLAFVASLSGCNIYIPSEITIRHEGLDGEEPVDPPPPGDDYTFAQLHSDILKPKCQACHNEAAPKANFSVETYASFMRAVAKGDPDNSLVFYRVGVKKDMPLGGPLPGREIETLKVWIEKGALEK